MTFLRAKTVRIYLFMSVACLSPAVTFAQGSPESAGARSSTRDTIIVTAQRREESIQDVPIAVTAIGAEALDNGGIRTAQDLQIAVPGLNMAQVRHNIQPYLRSVGTQNTSPGEEGSVATYIDGVYVNYMSAATFGLANIERVEVLKGPQGTLFGRNATGGVLHVVTREPQSETEILLDASYGNFQTAKVAFYATGGLSENVSADFSAYYYDQANGFGDNLVAGGEANVSEDISLRSKVRWEPRDGTSFELAADWGRHESDIGNTRKPLPGVILAGGIASFGGPFDSIANDPNNQIVKHWGLTLRANHQLPFATVESTTAYRDYDEEVDFDQDAGPVTTAFIDSQVPVETFQQELSLRGSTSNLDWNFGAFFYNARSGYQPLIFSALNPPSNREFNTEMRTTSYALYAQGTYDLFDNTQLTVGARGTRDIRKIEGTLAAAPGNPAPVGTVFLASTDMEKYLQPSWRVALDHKLSDDIMVYASQSRGFKSGIFSATTFFRSAVEPEILDATEFGFKSSWFDQQLVINASAFLYTYRDIQLVQVSAGTSRILNAAKGKPKGVDFEIVAYPELPAGALRLSVSGAYLDAKYDSFPNAPATTRLPAGGNLQTVADATGNYMIRSPKFSGNISADYSIPVGAKAEVGATVTLSYSDEFFFDPDNRVSQGSISVLNARVRFQTGAMEFYVYGQNLTDELYLTGVSTTNLGDLGVYGSPRRYGGGVKLQF